jgi:hypothetical protein
VAEACSGASPAACRARRAKAPRASRVGEASPSPPPWGERPTRRGQPKAGPAPGHPEPPALPWRLPGEPQSAEGAASPTPRLVECLCQTLEPFGVCGDRPDICVEDDVLGGGGTDDRAQPAQVRRAPGGPSGIPASMPQPKGCEAARGRRESVERLFPRAAQVTHSCVVDRWDRDRCAVPCAHQARPLDGIPTIRCDTVAGLLRDQGRGDDPAAVAFYCDMADLRVCCLPVGDRMRFWFR